MEVACAHGDRTLAWGWGGGTGMAMVLTPRLVEEAHRRNIPVHVWTIDEPDDMRRLLSWGVDAIQTDRPDLLSEVLVAESGRPFPPVKRRSGSL